jgi:hypothetical protein
MSALSFMAKLLRGSGTRRTTNPSVRPRPRPAGSRLSLESLEDRNLLSLSFAPAVSFPVGLRPESIVTADLNNDGRQDIAVLNQGQPPDFTSTVSVLLGNGGGTFRPAVTTGLLPGANSVAAGDFNGDGRLDLAISNRLTDVVEVLRGNGDGTFQANPVLLPVRPNGATFPTITSVAVGDFQHNGTLDIAVTSAASNTVGVFLGNGDGTFQARIDYAVGVMPLSVVAADLGNGQVDLVVANHDSGDVSVLLGNGDGTFQPAQNLDVNFHDAFGNDSHPLTLRVGDFNGDGKPDLLISQFVGSDAGESFVTVLPGNGDGTFQAPIHTDVGFGLFGLAVADFNGDGKLDFASADAGAFFGGFPAHVFLGNGDGTFGNRNVFPTGGQAAFGVATGDFNGDGRPDLAVANTFSDDVSVLLNTSTGAVAAATATTLGTSTATAVFGQTVLLTAAVTSPAGVSTGTITFLDGTTILGTAQVDVAGQATLAVSLGVGSHALTASFAGTGGFADSTSAAVTETVSRASTRVGLGSSVNPAVTGQAVTFTATVGAVAPGAGTPTGTVTFKDGDVVLGAVAVGPGGTATFTTGFAAAGGHVITAVYSGDPNFEASSQALAEQVNAPATRKATTLALFASANPAVVGQAVTFTATVRGPAGSGTPTGTVTFFVGNTAVARVALDANGRASFTRVFSRAGRFTIRAVYSGDANFDASSQSLTEQVIR